MKNILIAISLLALSLTTSCGSDTKPESKTHGAENDHGGSW